MLYIENGDLKNCPVTEQSGAQLLVYEVLRVIDGIALFAEDHFARFLKSCAITGVPCPIDLHQFIRQLDALIQANRIEIANIKIDFHYRPGGENTLQLYTIPHSYPTAFDYRFGVRCGLLKAERLNPQAKVVQHSVRERANEAITGNNLFEVLLVNEQDCITEGSRSNVFFIKGETVFTAPAEQVLLGITRAKVLDCIAQLGLECKEESIQVNVLAGFDAAFISGTSPKILPIAQIGEIKFSVDDTVLRSLMEAYDRLISSYILERKTIF